MKETKQQRYDSQRKTVKTRFLLDTEYHKLLKAIDKAGYSKGEINKYMKYIALEGKVIIKTAPIQELKTGKRLLSQVRRLYGNINQLTRLANEKRETELNRNILTASKDIYKRLITIEDLCDID